MSGILRIISKKLVGTGAEKYLPYALSKLDALVKTYRGFTLASNTQVDDGTFIRIESPDGVTGSVLIIAGGAGYEFFTTGPTVTSATSLGFPVYRGYGVAAKVNVEKLTAKGRGLGSTIDQTSDPLAMQTFLTRKAFQIGGIPEHTYYPAYTTGERPFLIDSWAESSEVMGINALAIEPTFRLNAFDIAYDIAPTLLPNINKPAELPGVPDADWYKRACVRTVTHPKFGSRQFIVMTDARNVFYAYPVTATEASIPLDSPYTAQGIKTTLPSTNVQQLDAPLPLWVRKPPAVLARDYFKAGFNGGDFLRLYPPYRWSFNSTGTRCAAIVLRDQPPGYDPIHDGYPVGFDASGAPYDLSGSLPGLVELQIDLALTGFEPGQFSFALSPARVIDPQATQRFLVAADYAFAVPGLATADDLLIMEGDYYNESSVHQGFIRQHASITVKNETTGFVLYSFLVSTNTADGELVPPTSVPRAAPLRQRSTMILAYDLRLLGFVLQQTIVEGLPSYDGTLSRRATRLVTYAYGEQVRVQNLGTFADLNAALPGAFDSFSRSGWVRQDPTAKNVGNFFITSAVSAYRRTTAADRADPTQLGLWQGSSQYRAFITEALASTAYEMFTVHPEGHWSIVTQPTAYFPGPETPYLTGPDFQTDVPVVSTLVQGFVDIVRFKLKQKDNSYKYVEKAHVDLVNDAYGLGLTAEDFYYIAVPIKRVDLAVGEVDGFNDGFESEYMGIFGTIGPRRNQLIGYLLRRTVRNFSGVNAGNRRVEERYDLTAFESHRRALNFYTGPRDIDPASNLGRNNQPSYIEQPLAEGVLTGAPILRGSSLLYGTLNPLPKATP